MAESSLRLKIREDRFATITFDAVGRSTNLLTLAVWQEFEKALLLLERQTDIRGLILKSGKAEGFIAGADLKLLGDAVPNDPRVKTVIDLGRQVLLKLEAVPFPTCAIIDGPALGGGLEVAMACDILLLGMSRTVEVGLPETKFGLIPGWGGTQRLPRIVGLPTAADLLTTGKKLTAIQAAEIELGIGPIDSDMLLPSAIQVMGIENWGWQAARRQKQEWIPAATRAAYRAVHSGEISKAVREAIGTMVAGAELPLEHALAREAEGFFRLAGSAESRRLIAEFFADKKPSINYSETMV